MISKEMEYVYTVYLEKSFSKAAKKLFVSQPALSTAIKKVEAELRVPLFDRSANPIRLTPGGKVYIAAIEQMMAVEQQMTAQLSKLSGEKDGGIYLGAAPFFCTYVLPPIVREYQDRHPSCKINFLEANAQDLSKCLQTGAFDLALCVETLDPHLFDSRMWKEEHIVLAVPADYAVNERLTKYRLTFDEVKDGTYLSEQYAPVSMKYFEHEPFILQESGNDMYQRSMAICRSAGFQPREVMYLDQMLTSYYVASAGKGIALIRDDVTRHVQKNDRMFFYKIDDERATRKILLYYKKNPPLTRAAQDFVEYFCRIG